MHNEVCNHNIYGFEDCDNFIPAFGTYEDPTSDNCGVLCEYAEELIKNAERVAIASFVSALEQNAKTEIYQRPKAGIDYEAKFLYIEDIQKIASLWYNERE